jgi:hypothetical protein
MSTATERKYASKAHPCPVCEATDGCSTEADAEGGGLIMCRKRAGPQPGFVDLGPSKGDAQFRLYRRDEESSNGKPRIIAAYDYRDERGQVLYQVVRFLPKDFRQRRPNGKGGWTWNLQGVRRVLYRLPELLAAPPEEPAFVVEGEKDVENLRKVEVLATTNAGGAGKWRADYNEALRGRHVVILPDNDQKGRDHARDVAAQLAGMAASVKVLELPGLPEKGDVSDWLAAGGDKVKLLQLAARTTAGPSVQSVGSKSRYRPLPAYRSFPLGSLPPVLCDLVSAAAEAIGCDPALVALPALAVAAGCVGNARAVVLKRGWIEPAVTWSLTVAESGGHKTPAYHAATQPLLDLQLDLFDQYQERLAGHKQDVQNYKDTLRSLRNQKLPLPKGLIEPPAPEKPPEYITTDTTIEKLGALLGNNPHGLLMARDELDAWFQSFTRFRGKGGTDRPQWLELHKAGTLIIDRLTREQQRLAVRRAAVSVTGTIQPAVLARALDLDALQAGLGARFLLAMPPRRKRVWTERSLPDDVADSYRQLLLDLLGLPLADAVKRKGHYLGLSEAAQRQWVAFYNEWGQAQHDAEGEQAAAFAKIEAYGARLALLHHVVTEVVLRGPRVPQGNATSLPPITDSSAKAGIELARWFAAEALRVYAVLHESQEERATRKLVEWIAERGGRVTVRQLQKSNHHRWPSSDLAEIALELLVQARQGRWEEAPARDGGERETRWFVLAGKASDTSDTSDTGEGEVSEVSEANPDSHGDSWEG